MAGVRDLRVGVDIGGTFTDVCVLGEAGIVAVGKTLTTHAEPAAGVESLLRDTFEAHDLDPARVGSVVHGTTLVTNALIERSGATTALLSTAGFRDVVEMGREHRYELYDLDIELPRPLVPRHLRFDVPERILSDGSVAEPLDVGYVERLAGELQACGVEAVAVAFLHGFVNDEHERRARDAISAAAPALRVGLSSEVNPEIREYERTSTTLANVYVQSMVEAYLEDLRSRIRSLGILSDPTVMLSNGGVATLETARRFPIRLLESGPAGGVLGAVAFGDAAGRSDQMTFDMGGTTAKLCMVEDGRPLVTNDFEVDRVYRLLAGSGLPVRAPVIDMIEIGAGGGSIARVDALGLVTVGPDSAGSEPGPVCYGGGGEWCTVTDADLVLGYLDPERFLGGRMTLDVDAAARAVDEQIATPMGITVAEAAWGIHTTVNENMANAARVHAVERGQDPTRHALFVFGGNGPVHGPGVALSLGAPTVVVPPAAGVLSALGFLAAPMSFDLVHSSYVALADLDEEAARSTFADLEAQGERVLVDSGVDPADVTYEHSLEMRFVGQGTEIEVLVPPVGPGWADDVRRCFGEQYERRYGAAMPGAVEVEILSWRLTARGPEPRAVLRLEERPDEHTEPITYRDAYFPGLDGFVSTPVYDRYRLAFDHEVVGPALIEEDESTLVLAPGMRCVVGKDFSCTVSLTGEAV